jgi:hypothetical protein
MLSTGRGHYNHTSVESDGQIECGGAGGWCERSCALPPVPSNFNQTQLLRQLIWGYICGHDAEQHSWLCRSVEMVLQGDRDAHVCSLMSGSALAYLFYDH